jgi:endonuclease/exonuclease/phosphatase family metal-dependent hydrolase
MENKISALCAICLFLFFLQNLSLGSETFSEDTLKIVTFNLYGRPETEWPTRLGMDLDALTTLKPDIIAFQEVVQTPGTGGIDNRARVIAESLFVRTGIGYELLFERTHTSWNVFDEGIAILTPHIIQENDFLDLPAGLFPRKVLQAQILTPSGIVNLFNTHLSFGNQEPVRINQVKAIKGFIQDKSQQGNAVINLLCGDFNDIPNSPPILLLTETDSNGVRYLDSWNEINPGDPGFTIPSDAPDARIDYIFLKESERDSINDSYLILDEPNENNIFPSDHIGILSSFTTTMTKIDIELLSPSQGEVVEDQYMIKWTHTPVIEDYTSSIYLSENSGKTWDLLWSQMNADTSYAWNSFQKPDATTYLLRIAVYSDSSIGIEQSEGTFTINNPGNAAPEVALISPQGGITIKDAYLIRWNAVDADGDSLSISLDYSFDDGSSWIILQQGMANTGSYSWNTRSLPNSSLYRIRLRCADDSVEVAQTSGKFSIENERFELSDSLFAHVAGIGGGNVSGKVVDPDQLTGNFYRITFDDTLFEYTRYSVYDVDRDSLVVQNAFELDGVTEGPFFDGLRLLIFNYSEAVVNHPNTRWLKGNTTLNHSISLPVLQIGEELIEGFPYPADYIFTIFDEIVDTSSTFLDVPAVPMKFKVYNMTENRQVEVMFIELDNNMTISNNDQIYILEKDPQDETMLAWYIVFTSLPGYTLPEAGDEFLLATLKPFTSEDIYEFKSPLTKLQTDNELIITQFELKQNFPNPFNPETTIEFSIPVMANVSLKIYNILGEEIETLFSENLPAGQYAYTWYRPSGLASGVYLYRLRVTHPSGKAESFVETRKMILLR